MDVKELELLAEKNRKRLVEVVYAAKAGHIGGDLSCLNVMTALYFHVMKNLTPNPSPKGEGNFDGRGRTPQESFERMFEHLRRLLPEATEKQIAKLIK